MARNSLLGAPERRRDVETEKVALAEVVRRHQAEGSTLEDVSDPNLKAGFDLKVLRADASLRYVEVKGRSATQTVELAANEWARRPITATATGSTWSTATYTVPQLYPVPDPSRRLLARATGAVRINARDLVAAAEFPPRATG